MPPGCKRQDSSSASWWTLCRNLWMWKPPHPSFSQAYTEKIRRLYEVKHSSDSGSAKIGLFNNLAVFFRVSKCETVCMVLISPLKIDRGGRQHAQDLRRTIPGKSLWSREIAHTRPLHQFTGASGPDGQKETTLNLWGLVYYFNLLTATSPVSFLTLMHKQEAWFGVFYLFGKIRLILRTHIHLFCWSSFTKLSGLTMFWL